MLSQTDAKIARASERIREKESGKVKIGQMACHCCGKAVVVTESGKLKQLGYMCQHCGFQSMARYPESQNIIRKKVKVKDNVEKENRSDKQPERRGDKQPAEPAGGERKKSTFFG